MIVLDNKTNPEEDKKTNFPPPFHQRFNIEVPLEDAQQRFRNRVMNHLELLFPKFDAHGRVMRAVATELGIAYSGGDTPAFYVGVAGRGEDFAGLLQCLEALHKAVEPNLPGLQVIIDKIVREALSHSEIDLGIEWKAGVFWKSGAKLLDKELVNEPLQWLSDPKYKNVLAPFKKGLSHYLEASKAPERLSDAVTDMYEALEAMAKIVTQRPTRDLSANAELFVKKLGLSKHYSTSLKEYIGYANEFRHGQEEGKERVPPAPQEVEAFIYATGMYFRLAVERMKAQGTPR